MGMPAKSPAAPALLGATGGQIRDQVAKMTPPKPMDLSDPALQAKRDEEKRRQKSATGLQSTFLTGPNGLSPVQPATKTLLGS